MKKLALFLLAFLAVPLAAWAALQENQPVVSEQFAAAAAHCTANNINPSNSKWGPCVNEYLQINYEYQLVPVANHWLVMVRVVSQFAPLITVLPATLPANTVSWNLPVSYSASVYQDGNRGWCVFGPPVVRACGKMPEVAYVKFLENIKKEPQRWPHMGGEHIQPY